jgi:hypothetical protein
MSMGVQDAVRRLKGHLAGCERGLVDSADAGDELIFDQADPTAVAKRMIAGVKAARGHLDAAHELLRTDLRNGAGDGELSVSASGRKRRLDVLDRADVGRAAPPPAVKEIGGAFLMARAGAAQQDALWQYWTARR